MVDFVMVAEVIKARGVKGELLVHPETASMKRFLSIRSVWIGAPRPPGKCETPANEHEPACEAEGIECESAQHAVQDLGINVVRRNFDIEWSRNQGELALVKLKGVDTREDAMTLRGLALEIPRREVPPLPDGEHYMFELVGMKVTRTDGIELGTVAGVLETGSNIVYIVISAEGKEVLVPATLDVVESINYENCEILVRPVPGLFDE